MMVLFPDTKMVIYESYCLSYTFIAVNCKWGDFGKWNQCTKTCGAGTQTRSRVKIQEAEHGGAECKGSSSEKRACNLRTCPGNINTNYDTNNCRKFIVSCLHFELLIFL